MTDKVRNWIFLGDSLTEGLGSARTSYVTELGSNLRAASVAKDDRLVIHELRLKQVAPGSFDPFVKYNVAGYLNRDETEGKNVLWLWNLASEGCTVETDFEWLLFVENLQPEIVFLFRGSLESILRPSSLASNSWPWWVPPSWRGFAAMDPRCYFSTTWWRKAKQVPIDAAKQMLRLKLLQLEKGIPLMGTETFVSHYSKLLMQLRESAIRVIMLGLLPVSDRTFPGSSEYFKFVNEQLNKVAIENGAEFLDWAATVSPSLDNQDLYYRDGFHPNAVGARTLADILHQHLAV